MKINLKMLSFISALFIALTASSMASDISPLTVDGAKTIDAAQAKDLFDKGVVFIDLRKQVDWDAGRIPDAIHLDVKSAFTKEALLSEITAADPVVMYCNGEKCMRSSKGSAMAVTWGYSNVYYFRDGFPAWKSAGYPVE